MQIEIDKKPDFWGVPELAKILKVHAATLRTLISDGQLTATIHGRNLAVSRRDLARFMGDDSLEWFTVVEVAEKLQLCTMTVRREVDRGALGFALVGRQYRFSEKMLEKYFRNK
jgi:excisionase family DNA binding protein